MTSGWATILGAILNWSDFAVPIYEFRCNSCNTKQSVFVRRVSQKLTPVCDRCGSKDLSRLVSAVAHHRSIQDVWEQSGSPDSPGSDYYKDPRNIGRWAENKFKEMGEDMPGHVREMIDAARDGDLPDSVSSLQPGLKEV